MTTPDFFWGHLPFWIVNYGLSLVVWACVGRWLLSFFMPMVQANYIWRSFVWLTGWAVGAAAIITPSALGPRWHPLIAAFWLMWLRVAFYFVMAAWGLTPRVSGG
jgi:hypothetical protein